MTMPESRIRVALVDDQELVRAGLAMVIDSQPDMRVVGQAGDGAAVPELLARHPADVVLMDVRMRGLDGIEATRRLLSGAPEDAGGTARDVKVIMLTTFDLDDYVLPAIRAGASGFLVKDARPEELLAAIRNVHGGDAVIAPSTTRRLLERVAPLLADPAASAGRLDVLTVRERDVLVQIGRGLSNKEIAAHLVLSEATVKTHVGHIFLKLGLRDRVQAVVAAYETGLVIPGQEPQ